MMQRQMELFGDGGLKDEGGMIDEVSGNEVPIGGTREGVRDDIPANVSEGEFIFPADVTRYLGLEKLMQLRQQAKMGLQEMDAMGQMGNSDEATMDDDLPFGMADIMVVSAGGEPMEFADGGFVPTKNYAPGGMGMRQFNSLEELEEFQKQNPSLNLMTEYKRLKALQPQLQPEAGMGVSTTRSLSPEIVAPARTKIDFKQLMGEAAIEFKEYRNEEGKSITVAHIGGVAAFPIPEGYTLYVADDSIGNGDTATDDIVADANDAAAEKAAAEKALSDEPYNAGYSSTASSESTAIDWENLSTDKLLEELAKITGVGSTIAKGAMVFLGPAGLAGYALIRNQEKKAAKATQARIAKGGLPSSQLAEFNKYLESLTTKSFGLFGKVLETVGGALGLTTEDVEETKKKAGAVEGQTIGSQEFEGEITEPIPMSTANMASDLAKDGKSYQQKIDEATRTYREALSKNIPQDRIDAFLDTIENGSKLRADGTRYREGLGKDAVREIVSNVRPDYMKYNKDGDLESVGEISGYVNSRQNEEYNLPAPGSKLTSEESIAKRKDAASAYTPPSYDPVVTTPAPVTGYNPNLQNVDPVASVPASVATQTEDSFTPSTPSYDMFGKPFSNATTRFGRDNLLSSMSERANELQKTRATPMGRRSILEPDATATITPQSPVVRRDLLPESGPVVSASTIDVVPPSPVTGLNLTPEAASATATLNATETGRGVPYYPTAPTTPAPVTGYNPNLQNVDPVTTAPAVDPRDVGSQTQQAFLNPAGPEDRYAGYVSQTGTGSYDEVPSSLTGAPKVNTGPAGQSTSFGELEGQYSTSPAASTALTFNEKFAAERLAGAKTFSYDRDGDGTMESYTTKTVEEVSPKRSDSLYERIANFLTPGDDKEYKDGVLYNTKTNKPIVKKKITSAGASSQSNTQGSVDKETTASNAINTLNSAIDKAQSLGSDADPKEYYDTMMAQSNASKAATKAIKERTAERKAKEANAYQGGLLTKPKSKKKTKVTTKKRGLAARK